MAVVRILSDDAEYREKLIKDLQGRGFEVEIAMPTENGQDASPQISISECTFEELPQLAASLQQDSGTTASGSTDAIAFLVPQLLSGVHSLKAFIVRSSLASSKLQPELSAEAQASSQPVSNESEENTAFAVPPSPLTETQPVSHPLQDAPPVPKFKISRKKKEKKEDSDLVPHGLIWQAISEASAVSAQQELSEAATPVENFATLESKGLESQEVELPEMKSPDIKFTGQEVELSKPEMDLLEPEVESKNGLPEIKELPAMQFQSSFAAPVHLMNSKPARPRSLAPFRTKNPSDRRFWNVAALAVGAAILALLALPHVHRLTPLPGVEAHIAQPETAPTPAANIVAPSKVENISHPSTVAVPAVKRVTNKSNDDKLNDEKSGLLAKDTVVRFGSKSEETHDVVTKQPQHKTGVRYFSDLD